MLPGPPPFYNIRLKAEGSDEWRGQPGLLSAELGWSNLYSCPAKAVPGRASVAGWRMERVCKRHFSSPIHHLFTVPRVRALASKRKHSLLGLVQAGWLGVVGTASLQLLPLLSSSSQVMWVRGASPRRVRHHGIPLPVISLALAARHMGCGDLMAAGRRGAAGWQRERG